MLNMLTSTNINRGHNDLQELLYILNGKAKKTQSTTKSFRLDHDILNKIDQQARSNNTSLNSEINSILRKYVEWDMLANKVGMVSIAKPIVSEIFQNIMTKEQVIHLAQNVAKNVTHEVALFMKGNLTLELFLSWLMTRMEHSSEINYAIENNSINPQIRIMFKHDLGENWSRYHKIILEYIFYEILGINTVWVEVSPTTFHLCFR
jgi:hypothetical protein